jgi:hypothetical protein
MNQKIKRDEIVLSRQRLGGLQFEAKKFIRPPSQPTVGHGGASLSPQLYEEAQIGRRRTKMAWHKVRPYLKNKQY